MNNLNNISKYRCLHPTDKQLVINPAGELKNIVFNDVIEYVLMEANPIPPSEISVFESLKNAGLTRKYVIFVEFVPEDDLNGFLREIDGGDNRYFLHSYNWEWEINAIFEVRIQNMQDITAECTINSLETKNGIKNPIKLDYKSNDVLGNRLSSKYITENYSFLVRDCLEKPSNTNVFTLVLEPFAVDEVFDNILSLSMNNQEKGFVPLKLSQQYIQSVSLDYPSDGGKRIKKSMRFPNMGKPGEVYFPEVVKLKTHNKDGTPINMTSWYLVGEPEEMVVGKNILPIDEEKGEDFDFVKRINVILNLKATRKNIMAVNFLKAEIGRPVESYDIPVTQMVDTYNQDGLYREVRSVYDETDLNLKLDYPDYYKYLQQYNPERLRNGQKPNSFYSMASLYPEFQHDGRIVTSFSKTDDTGTYFADQIQTLGLTTTATTNLDVKLSGGGSFRMTHDGGNDGAFLYNFVTTGDTNAIIYGITQPGQASLINFQSTAKKDNQYHQINFNFSKINTSASTATTIANTSSSSRQGTRTEMQNITVWKGIVLKAGLNI